MQLMGDGHSCAYDWLSLLLSSPTSLTAVNSWTQVKRSTSYSYCSDLRLYIRIIRFVDNTQASPQHQPIPSLVDWRVWLYSPLRCCRDHRIWSECFIPSSATFLCEMCISQEIANQQRMSLFLIPFVLSKIQRETSPSTQPRCNCRTLQHLSQ